MADAQEFPMGLHLPGLLQILGEHLYSDPRVALREALQNAHDSCQRRRIEADSADYQPRILVFGRKRPRRIEIQDNGSGLTPAEVHSFLATIGRSYTGELRGKLDLEALEATQNLIGQFGLGLLSGFLLASRVTLTTRSYQDGATALEWSSTGGQTYTLREVEDHPIGSTLRLDLKPLASFLVEPGQLEQTLRSYIDFLPVPVHVDGSGEPVNQSVAPWHEPGAGEEDYARFVRHHFGVEPLTVIPVHDHKARVGRISEVTLPLAGVLFIPPASVTSLREYGDVAVYIRRMFITDHERDLLPPWARFVRGLIESPRLRPTVSREALRQDVTYLAARQALGEQLLAHLRSLAAERPETWREIVIAHNDLIKGWSVQEPDLFAAVADLVHFRTSRGRLPLAEIRRITGDRVYYYSDETGSNQEKMLYEAMGLLVIDASHFAEEAFLKQYQALHPEVRLEQLRPGAQTFFRPAPAGPLVEIVAFFESRGVACRTVKFRPGELPALLVFPPAHDQLRRMRDVVEGGPSGSPLGELMEDYLQQRLQSGGGSVPTLHLNVDSPLLQELAQQGPRSFVFAPALELMHQSARFFAGKDMEAAEAREAFTQAMQSLHTLLELGKGRG